VSVTVNARLVQYNDVGRSVFIADKSPTRLVCLKYGSGGFVYRLSFVTRNWSLMVGLAEAIS